MDYLEDRRLVCIRARIDDLEVMQSCAFQGYGLFKMEIFIDLSVVRGLEYYTGPVFEISLPFRPTARMARHASARSAAADVMMASCRAFVASRCRRRGFPSACRDCSRRSSISAWSRPKPRPARWSSPCSTRTASPTTSRWSLRCAMPAFAPSFISARANSARR